MSKLTDEQRAEIWGRAFAKAGLEQYDFMKGDFFPREKSVEDRLAEAFSAADGAVKEADARPKAGPGVPAVPVAKLRQLMAELRDYDGQDYEENLEKMCQEAEMDQ